MQSHQSTQVGFQCSLPELLVFPQSGCRHFRSKIKQSAFPFSIIAPSLLSYPKRRTLKYFWYCILKSVKWRCGKMFRDKKKAQMSYSSGPTQFAYQNTLPNTKTFFPATDQAYHSSAPWVTTTSFSIPSGAQSAGCPMNNNMASFMLAPDNCTCTANANGQGGSLCCSTPGTGVGMSGTVQCKQVDSCPGLKSL
jgi:hypothetical protein